MIAQPLLAWNVLYGIILGFNLALVSLLSYFFVLNFSKRHYEVGKVYLLQTLMVLFTGWGFTFYEQTANVDHLFSKNIKLFEYGKYVLPLSMILLTHIYASIFNIKKLEPSYIQINRLFFLYCLSVIFSNIFLSNKQVITTVLLSVPLLCCLLIGIHAHRSSIYISYGKTIRNLSTLTCLVMLILIFFNMYNIEVNSIVILATGITINLILLGLTLIFILFIAEEITYFRELGTFKGGNLLQNLVRATKKNTFYMVYQPQVSLKDCKVVGFEALIRWKDPIFGFIPPNVFIPIAEDANLIDKITIITAEKSIAMLSKLRQKKYQGTLSINVSTRSLKPQIAREIIQLLDKYDVPSDKLIIEVTETSLLSETPEVKEAIKLFSDKACPGSLDDYGTGFSSLQYLNQLPLAELKIDQSFVYDLDKNEKNQVIVKSTLEMSHLLDIDVVAEGVENFDEIPLLKEMDCNMIQGYYIAKPLKQDELLSWINTEAETNFTWKKLAIALNELERTG